MPIKYRILSVDDNERSFVVRFFSDELSEEELASHFDRDGKPILGEDGKPVRCRTDINMTLYNDEDIDEDKVKEMITRGAPRAWFELKTKAKDKFIPKPSDALSKIVGKDEDVGEVPPRPEAKRICTRRQILLGLAKEGIISMDEALKAAKNGTVPPSISKVFAKTSPQTKKTAEITFASMSYALIDDPMVIALRDEHKIPPAILEKWWKEWSQL